MREIKFRVWDKINKIMVTNENVKEVLNNEELIDDDYIYDRDEWYPAYEILVPLSYLKKLSNNKDFVLEQYTGLKDKNGVEIYDGDYIIINGITNKPFIGKEVFYENGAFQCAWSDGNDTFGGDTYLVDLASCKDIEVIGNIHEKEEK